jgi:5-methylcytosine-specific restriction endonuclease McrA
MIRYEIGRQDLIDRIQGHKPNWISRAKTRTEEYARAHDYSAGTEFWGEIKQVYIDLQSEKCAYCETKLQGAALASKVHEVEHFRPKSSVAAWPNHAVAHWKNFTPPCAMGRQSAKGYYHLAYHPFNYAIACTRCNSTLKSNYFPIRGNRRTAIRDPSWLHVEDPLLIYPISDLDDDPATIIAFDGVLAVPKVRTGPKWERAYSVINFFQLNHEDLTSRRAQLLAALWYVLETAATGTRVARAQARRHLDAAGASGSEFSGCVFAFRQLYESSRALADAKARETRVFAGFGA